MAYLVSKVMNTSVVVDGDNYYHYCKYKDNLYLSAITFRWVGGVSRYSDSSSHSLIKPKPTTATTTTNRPFSPFFEVVFVVPHRGVSFAYSSLRNANPKLP